VIVTKNTCRIHPQNRSQGFVLILVLLIVVLLTALLLRFNYAARVGLHSSDSFRHSQQALHYAQGGLNLAVEAIRQEPDIENNLLLRDLLAGSVTFSIDAGHCEVKLSDEGGKLNINRLLDPTEHPDRVRIEQLLRLIDLINGQYDRPILRYEFVPALLDWMDSDNQPTILPYIRGENRGAESNYYETLSPPYRCRNDFCDIVSDILLIKGMTPQAFYGRRNRPEGPNCRLGLSESLTVYGSGRININTAPKPVIQSLSEHMNAALAQLIIDRRSKKLFGSMAELREIPGMTGDVFTDLNKSATIQSEQTYYKVTARGSVGAGGITISAILYRNESAQNVEVIWYQES
jgi:general secretion pathway protein K